MSGLTSDDDPLTGPNAYRPSGEMANAISEGAPAGGVVMMAAIRNGDIRLEGGTADDVKKFFGYFDPPVDVGAIKLIVR